MQDVFLPLMILGIVGSSFIFVGWIIWMATRQRRERQQNEIALRSRVLEKFGSSDEFVQFMQTESGKKFLDTATVEKSVRTKVASSLSSGLILLMLGVAFFFMAWRLDDGDLMFPGAILSAIGVGLGISAAIYWRFGRDRSASDG